MWSNTPFEKRIARMLERQLGEAPGQNLFSRYVHAKHTLSTVWESVSKREPMLTDHGPRHIQNVLRNVARLIDTKHFTGVELYSLLGDLADQPAGGFARFLLGSVGFLDSGHASPERVHQVDHLRSLDGRRSHKLLARHFRFDQLLELAGIEIWVLLQVRAGDMNAPLAGVGQPGSPPFFGGQIVAGSWTDQGIVSGQNQGTSGPGLLRMAFSAMKSMVQFAGSGFKPTTAGTYEKRLLTW
jgi:hypothetical protein